MAETKQAETARGNRALVQEIVALLAEYREVDKE